MTTSLTVHLGTSTCTSTYPTTHEALAAAVRDIEASRADWPLPEVYARTLDELRTTYHYHAYVATWNAGLRELGHEVGGLAPFYEIEVNE